MDHVAILRKSSQLLEKILAGEKKIESRLCSARFSPWDRISTGDTIYFKYSGMPVEAKAKVKKVRQFSVWLSKERLMLLRNLLVALKI
jgi:ASC-1-like (ASCH) protein